MQTELRSRSQRVRSNTPGRRIVAGWLFTLNTAENRGSESKHSRGGMGREIPRKRYSDITGASHPRVLIYFLRVASHLRDPHSRCLPSQQTKRENGSLVRRDTRETEHIVAGDKRTPREIHTDLGAEFEPSAAMLSQRGREGRPSKHPCYYLIINLGACADNN